MDQVLDLDEEKQISIKTAAIVLEDRRDNELITKFLEAFNIMNVIVHDDGAKAWQEIMQQKIDMLIMGWDLKSFSGVALLNRFRQLPQNVLTPVMIISEKIAPLDFTLLQELPCVRHMQKKPLNGINFEPEYQALVEDATWYQHNQALIENLIDFAESDPAKVMSLLRSPLSKAPNPVPLAILMARKLRENNFVDPALQLLNDVIKKAPNSTACLSEMGKAYYLKGETAKAESFLEKAQSLSPKNIARLCLLAEIDLVQDKASEAMNRFTKALEIDPADATSTAGVQMIKAANRAGHEGKSGTHKISGESITRSLAGMLNMNAVRLSRSGKYREAVEAYNAALNLVTQGSVRAKIIFNAGMAFMRWTKLEKALEWFSHAADIADPSFVKAARYAALIEERLRGQRGPQVESLIDEQGVEVQRIDYSAEAQKPKEKAQPAPPPAPAAELEELDFDISSVQFDGDEEEESLFG